MDKNKQGTRREAATGATAAAPSATSLPSRILRRARFLSPNDKANIAFVGIGNCGGTAPNELSTQNILALSDVDWLVEHYRLSQMPETIFSSPRAVTGTLVEQLTWSYLIGPWPAEFFGV